VEKKFENEELKRIQTTATFAACIQAYFGDIVGSVPDHRNKASAYKSYVYTIL
jgi:hypothetical protein